MKLPILRKLHLTEHKSHLSSAHMPGLMPIRSGQILYYFTSCIFILLKNSHSVPYLFLPCFHCKCDIGIASLRTIIQRLETLAISSVFLSQNIYLTQGPNINCMCSTSTNGLSVFIRKSGLRNSPAALCYPSLWYLQGPWQ